MINTTIKKILAAQIYDLVVETPLDTAPILSHRLNNSILIKREDLQPVFSFKLRGAYAKMLQLTESEKSKGVIAASAGNHAQGVAYVAQKMGIKATIVMPGITQGIKVDAVKYYGAEVLLHGDNFDAAAEYAQQLVKEQGLVFVHPYDDIDVIAGQGTVGLEILRQATGSIDAIFVPVGGGGLIAGVSAYTKYLRPEIKIIGVEPDDAACCYAALQAGQPVKLEDVGIFVDGAAVALLGKMPFEIIKTSVDDIVRVSSDEICAAIKDIFDDTRSIAEPAGALALAGLKKYVEENAIVDNTLVAIDSGANTNFDRLRYISERAELGEKREIILAVTIPEQAGSFKTFCKVLGRKSITEFNYRYDDADKAQIFVGIKISFGNDEVVELIDSLRNQGYAVEDMTDNEMAKLHIRYMVGGRAPAVDNEIVYRFEFPEHPGALLNFLNKLGQRWSISMFHYRNHGAAFGRVLVGLELGKDKRCDVEKFMSSLNYRFWEETENSAYQLFLS